MSKLLALDMATQMGWAWVKEGGQISGTIKMEGKARSQRLHWFRSWLIEQLDWKTPDAVVYEQPIAFGRRVNPFGFHLEGIALQLCEERLIPVASGNLMTVKKWAAGKGNATKDEMVIAAARLWPGVVIEDDNQADALCLGAWALSEVEL